MPALPRPASARRADYGPGSMVGSDQSMDPQWGSPGYHKSREQTRGALVRALQGDCEGPLPLQQGICNADAALWERLGSRAS